jgi:hypothetical protein
MDLQPDETPQPLARRRTRAPSNQRLRANFPLVVLHGRVPPPSKPLVADWRKAGSAIKCLSKRYPVRGARGSLANFVLRDWRFCALGSSDLLGCRLCRSEPGSFSCAWAGSPLICDRGACDLAASFTPFSYLNWPDGSGFYVYRLSPCLHKRSSRRASPTGRTMTLAWAGCLGNSSLPSPGGSQL